MQPAIEAYLISWRNAKVDWQKVSDWEIKDWRVVKD